MISGAIQKWSIIFMTVVMASPQFPLPYPMFGQPPMMPMMPALPPMVPAPPPMMPPPLNMQMQIGLAIVPDEDATSTTTTATTKNDEIAIAIPMPMPLPMPMAAPMPMPALFAVPGMMSSVCKKNLKHPNCPPCPPCSCSPCTPSFFSYCSPCHQKCRCRNPKDVPLVPPPKAPFPLQGPAFPMPYPGHLPNSPNVAFVPYPPHAGRPKWKKGKPKIEDSDSNSCEYYKKKKKNKRLNRKYNKDYGIYRRSNRRLDFDRSDNMIAKPVLNFMSHDGKVRLERRLSKIDASLLMSDDNSLHNRHMTNTEPNKKIITYPLERGKKKMVFRPPPDMMVGNLSVSFNTKFQVPVTSFQYKVQVPVYGIVSTYRLNHRFEAEVTTSSQWQRFYQPRTVFEPPVCGWELPTPPYHT